MKSRRKKTYRRKGGMLRRTLKSLGQGTKIVTQGVAKNQLQKEFDKVANKENTNNKAANKPQSKLLGKI